MGDFDDFDEDDIMNAAKVIALLVGLFVFVIILTVLCCCCLPCCLVSKRRRRGVIHDPPAAGTTTVIQTGAPQHPMAPMPQGGGGVGSYPVQQNVTGYQPVPQAGYPPNAGYNAGYPGDLPPPYSAVGPPPPQQGGYQEKQPAYNPNAV